MASTTERLQLILEAQVRGTEEIQKLNAAMAKFDKSTADAGATSKKVGTDFDGFADKLTNAIRNPLEAASQAAGGFVRSLGPMGVAIGGTTTVVAAAGVAIFNLAKAYGDLYEQQSNNAQRLGVSIREYGLLARVSTEAGVAGDAFVGTIRGLSKALSDNSEEGQKAKVAMAKWGITATDVFGATRPMRDVILEIADRLGKIQDPAEKADAAIKIMGKGALEILPLMNSELRQQIQEMERAGEGWTVYGEKVGAATDKTMDAFNRKWEQVSKAVKQYGAEVFLRATAVGGDPNSIFEIEKEKAYRDRKDAETREVRLAGGLRGDGKSLFAPGVSDKQLAEYELTMNRQKVAAFLGADLQGQLSATRSSLESAKSAGSLDEVKRLTAEYNRLEAQVKAVAKAEEERNKYAKYNADVMAAFLSGGSRKTDHTGLLNPGQMFIGGPSLLRPGETVNRGMLGIDPAVFQRNQANALTRSQSTTDFAARRAEASAFPGFELQAAQTAAAIRIAGLQQAKTLGMDIFQADMEASRIMQDLELSRLGIQRQRLSELRQQGGDLFNALTAGGGGLMSYGKGLLMGGGRTIFSNLFAEIGAGTAGKLTLPGQGTASNPNFLGRVLSGTPFGMDPMKTATDANTAATIANTQALMGGGINGVGKALAGFPWASGIGMADSIDLGTLSRMGMTKPADVFGGITQSAGKGGFSLAKGVGIAGAAVGGAFGAYSGFSAGGAQGALTGMGSLTGAAGAILAMTPMSGPAAPILAGIGMAMGVVAAMMGDPKKKEAARLQSEARSRYSEMPVGTDYATDIYGNKTDYNRRGELRPIIVQIQAMDAQSIIDRQEDIGEAVRQAVSSYPPLTTEIRGALFAS